MSFEKLLSVNNIKQLVDINGDATNFTAKFTVTSLEGKNFQMTVADQNMLDSDDPLQYKDVKGSISGTVSSDKNVYTNYYIAVKAPEPTQIKINVELKEMPLKDLPYTPKKIPPPNTESPSVPPPGYYPNPHHQQNQHTNRGPPIRQENYRPPQQAPMPAKNDDKNESFIQRNLWKIILIIIILAVGGYFIYGFIKNQKNGKCNYFFHNYLSRNLLPLKNHIKNLQINMIKKI